jgi:hypothetical protein
MDDFEDRARPSRHVGMGGIIAALVVTLALILFAFELGTSAPTHTAANTERPAAPTTTSPPPPAPRAE